MQFFLLGNSQNSWKYEYYKEINHKNYMTYDMFAQEINLNNPDIPLINALLFFMTNEIREKNGLSPLEYSEELEIAAYCHAQLMVQENFFSHTDKSSSTRREPDDRAKLAGISNPYIAENIAYTWFNTGSSYTEVSKLLIDMWMNSKGHRENILSKSALQGGSGVFINNTEIYGVQDFQWFKKIIPQKTKDSLPEEIKN